MYIQPLTYKKLIIGILAIVIIVFIAKLYNTFRNNSSEEFESIENFENILNKLKSNKRNNNSSRFKKNNNNAKLKKKVTFEDLLKESEEMDVEKYTISNMKKNIFDYVNSFKKDKFANSTGTTTEALDKFSFFKEKFFEIFV